MGTNGLATQLRAMDPNLPVVAAQAAVEVDALLNRRDTTFEFVKKLSELLKQSADRKNYQSSETKYLLDPITSDMLQKAYTDAHNETPISVEDLLEKASILSSRLQEIAAREQVTDATLESLKQFCVAMSKYALASRHEFNPIASRSRHKRCI